MNTKEKMIKVNTEFIKQLYFEDIIKAYSLKNAIEHKGIANEKSVYNSVMGHFNKKLYSKKDINLWVKERLPIIINEIIKDKK